MKMCKFKRQTVSHLCRILLLFFYLFLTPLLQIPLMNDNPAENDGVLHQREEHQEHAGQQPNLAKLKW